MEKKIVKLIINDEEDPNEYLSELVIINFNILSNLIWNLKKIRKNQIEFIRFKNIDNSWELISITSPDINITNLKSLNIMIQLIKKEKSDPDIESMIKKVKNLKSSIEQEISELKEPLHIKNTVSFNSLNLSKRISSCNVLDEEDLSILPEGEKPDIIILTANPLVYKDNFDEIKELRVINEFNSITYSIYHVVSNTNLPIISQFLTLTKNHFSYALKTKPKILHLICKSTYDTDYKNSSFNMDDKQENKNEIKEEKPNLNNNINNKKEIQKISYSPILLFENENCEMEKITIDILYSIFKGKEEYTKEITLFISTPLSQEIYDLIIESGIKFKNVIVQHTTLADISYMEKFNQDLYNNLLDKQTLEEAFNKAKVNSMSGSQFCCCYHRHKNECILKKKLSNEIFRINEENKDLIEENKCNNKFKTIEEAFKFLPHIFHLRYKCECSSKIKPRSFKYKDNFCYHQIADCPNRNMFNKKDYICCCKNVLKKNNNDEKNIKKDEIGDKHKLDEIFNIYKSDKRNIIFEKYENEEYKKCLIVDEGNVPNYGKMRFKIGFNIIFYNIFELIKYKDYNIINFFGNQYNSLEIDNIIYILIEYIKERNSYFSFENIKNNNKNYKNTKSNLNLRRNETHDNINDLNLSNISSEINLDMSNQISAKQLHRNFNYFNPFPNIIIINQESINTILNDNKYSNNIIYIINSFKFTDWNFAEFIKKIKTKLDLMKSYFIIFSSSKIKYEENKNIKIRNFSFNILDILDLMVKNQYAKIEKENEKDFEDLLIENTRDMEENEFNKIIENINSYSKTSGMCYILLYLFKCVYSRGLFLFEFENLFINNNLLKEAEKIRDIFVDKKILNVETNRDKGNKAKPFQTYTKYIKNRNVLNKILNIIKIPEDIELNVIKKLFLFYAKKFRFLIKKEKEERNNYDVERYKPKESLFSFSAIQSLGIWLPLNKSDKFNEVLTARIYKTEGLFNHLIGNFKRIFKQSIIDMCLNNNIIWPDVKESMEEISISLVTLCKIYSNKELEDYIQNFKNYFENEKYNFSKAAELRLKLFDIMQMHSDINKTEETLKKLENIEKGFHEINNKEGQLETIYAISILTNERGVLNNIKKNYEGKIKNILEELKKENNKNNFVDIFDAKINYKLIKYKIIVKKQYDLSDNFENLVKIFGNYNIQLYVIKTLLLISSYYKDSIGGKNNDDELKRKFLLYLNAANIYAINSNKDKNIDQVKEFIIKKKYSVERDLTRANPTYFEFKESIGDILKNCGLNPAMAQSVTGNLYDFK